MTDIPFDVEGDTVARRGRRPCRRFIKLEMRLMGLFAPRKRLNKTVCLISHASRSEPIRFRSFDTLDFFKSDLQCQISNVKVDSYDLDK